MVDTLVQIKRERAADNMGKFNNLLNTIRDSDPDFASWLISVLDGYMLNECQLGRINHIPTKESNT
jgi:hypothetical protein